MEMKQLEYFCAVARAGSFSRASSELMVVQPALSRQVGRLESELSTKLFYRNGRGVALTDAGKRFLAVADSVLGELENIRAELAEDRDAPSGTVTVGMPPSVSAMIATSLLLSIRRQFPDIKLHIIDGLSGHICEWMTAGKIDIGIVHESRQSSGLLLEPLMSEPLYLVGRPSATDILADPQGAIGTVSFDTVANLPLILQGDSHGLRRLIDRTAREMNVALDIEIEIDAIAAITKLVQVEPFFSILPIGCVNRQLSDREFSAWRITSPELLNVMLMASVPNKPFTSAMREVRRAIQLQIAAASAVDEPAESEIV
ncbi:LysR family transcriptional regulator [Martelella lutilitoris]|uniref:LysR family transcriptional regulator n=1 Tax=Martelella lutilitoris TaxID=2583532 RepID=A0A5C4JXR7_9HYPH|nr:LysR substrate-binding domain-containing protein [Martelella lutilitoris]TNB49409.1 LysR family transcriptional regulator [Martelella lutilitoris]